ncbi:MAG TPA: phosphatase PAP2 family protein [Metabacillus sp.]|nr:phosphatase PAP2 family protein [Metabacillus sp.]
MDKILFKIINQFAGRNLFLDRLMVFASNELRFVYGFVLVILLVFRHSNKKFVYELIISLMITLGLKKLINKVKYIPRPFLTRNANVLLPSLQDSSFLSKHTLLSFTISTTVYLYNRVLGKFLYFLSFLIGLSRIWVGAHYPYDIIRSSILGSMVSFLVNKLNIVKPR